MRKTTFKTKVSRLPDQSEIYLLELRTHNEVFTVKVDKENLRHHIEKIDNEIL